MDIDEQESKELYGKAALLLAVLVVVLVMVVGILWLMMADTDEALISPSPTPHFNLAGRLTSVELAAEYENPFDKDTQYVNPFDGYKSPFINSL